MNQEKVEMKRIGGHRKTDADNDVKEWRKQQIRKKEVEDND